MSRNSFGYAPSLLLWEGLQVLRDGVGHLIQNLFVFRLCSRPHAILRRVPSKCQQDENRLYLTVCQVDLCILLALRDLSSHFGV